MQKIFHEITHLFFVKKHIVEILKKNSKMFLMNCTYKTNKFKFSFFVIIEHISLNIIFYVKFAFLIKKHEKDFVWMLTALKKYFVQTKIDVLEILIIDKNMKLIAIIRTVFFDTVHFLCIWHVNKNVLIYCKLTFFITKTWKKFYVVWHNVIQSKIRNALNIAWKKLKNDYYVEYNKFIDYLNKIWIKIFVKKIVKCYINKICHYFIIIIFRSKKTHRILKQHLGFFTKNLNFVIDKIEILLMNQRKKYVIKFDEIKMRISFDLQIFLFRDFIFHVIFYVLKKIKQQYFFIKKKFIFLFVRMHETSF